MLKGETQKALKNRKLTEFIYTGFFRSTPALAGWAAFFGQGPKKFGQDMSSGKS
jgi:hypothetical protein